MPAGLNARDLAQQASFIFRGTVQRLKATTLEQVPITDRTVIVRVDEVLQAPESLRHYKGQRVTVQLGGTKSVRKGQQAVFYTNGWLFGESLAVQSIDHDEPATISQAGPAADPVRALEDRHLREHFDGADLVISGRVISIRVPAGEPRAVTEAALPADRRFSEHDPIWRIAQVAIDTLHKGQHAGKTVDVGFASSTDVRWFQAPKLHPGHEGHFMLHREPPPTVPHLREVTGGDVGDYVVLHPEDFQPLEQPGGIRGLVGGPASSESR